MGYCCVNAVCVFSRNAVFPYKVEGHAHEAATGRSFTCCLNYLGRRCSVFVCGAKLLDYFSVCVDL